MKPERIQRIRVHVRTPDPVSPGKNFYAISAERA